MTPKQKKLVRKYEKLSPASKNVLQLMSVVYKPVNRTEVVSLAAKAGIKDKNGKALVYKTFKQQLDSLIQCGVIHFHFRNGPVVVDEYLLDCVFQDAFLSENYQSFKQAIEEQKLFDDYRTRDIARLGKIRDAFYEGDLRAWSELTSTTRKYPVLLSPFRIESFDRLHPAFQAIFATKKFHDLAVGFEPDLDPGQLNYLIESVKNAEDESQPTVGILLDIYIAQGNLEALKQLHQQHTNHSEVLAAIEFLHGDYESSFAHFEAGLKKLRKRTKKRNVVFAHMPTLLYGALLLRQNTSASLKELERVLKQCDKWQNNYYVILPALVDAMRKMADPMGYHQQQNYGDGDVAPLFLLVSGWVWQWCFSDSAAPFSLKQIEKSSEVYHASGMNWLASECDALAGLLAGGTADKESNKQSAALHQACGTVSIVDFIKPVSKWEQALDAIEKLVGAANDLNGSQQTEQPLHDGRMIWELQMAEEMLFVEPYIQKFNKKGWTKGRKVALSRIYNDRSQFEFLSEQDRAICSTLREETEYNHYGYRENYYEFEPVGLLLM